MRHPRTSQPTLQVFSEQLEIDRLRNAGVAASLQNALPFSHHGVGGHGDYRDIAQRRLLAQPRGQAQTIIGAELNIQQHHMGMLFLHRLESCLDRKSTRLNSSHGYISYAVFCLKKKKKTKIVKYKTIHESIKKIHKKQV